MTMINEMVIIILALLFLTVVAVCTSVHARENCTGCPTGMKPHLSNEHGCMCIATKERREPGW